MILVARMLCKCGNLLSTTEVPNDVELRVYTDREWVEKIENQDTVNTWELPFPEHTVWRCPKCERIHVFGTGEDRNKVIRVYAVEVND